MPALLKSVVSFSDEALTESLERKRGSLPLKSEYEELFEARLSGGASAARRWDSWSVANQAGAFRQRSPLVFGSTIL